MIIMPRFSHCRDRRPWDVEGLHAVRGDGPMLWPAIMRKMSDEPVAVVCDRDPRRDAPYDPAPAADREEEQGDGQLLPSPRCLEPAVEWVFIERGKVEARRSVQVEPAIDLPPRVADHSRAVTQKGVALRLSLRPVAGVVRTDDAVGAGHTDEGAKPDERSREPARRGKTAVDHHTVIADRMAKQQCCAGGNEKQRDRFRCEEEWAGGQRGYGHAAVPQDARNIEANPPGDRIGACFIDQEIDGMGALFATHLRLLQISKKLLKLRNACQEGSRCPFMKLMDRVFQALASTPRRKILAYLAHAELSAGDISARFAMSKPAVSQHLSVLENAGLIISDKRGQFVFYRLVPDTLTNVLNGYVQEVCPVSRPLKAESRVIADGQKGEA